MYHVDDSGEGPRLYAFVDALLIVFVSTFRDFKYSVLHDGRFCIKQRLGEQGS
jgi:hypothetical protein